MSAEAFSEACRQAAKDVRRLPAEVRKNLGRRVRDEVAEPLAGKIRAAGRTTYARRVAPTTKVRSSGDPTIVVGGAKRVASGGAKGRDLVFGTHFGGGTRVTAIPARTGRKGHRRRSTKQFARRPDPFVFGTVARNMETTFEAWANIIDETVEEVIDRG